MNYREIKRIVRWEAASHLYSLDVYDRFPDDKDADKADRAIREIQAEILGGITIDPTISTKD